jgi:hypothetical protein
MIKESTRYPEKPKRNCRKPEIEAKWRTACAQFALDYLTKEDMVLTFLFHKWLHVDDLG